MRMRLWPSFAHYFKKLSAALDITRTNLNSVWKNLTFNALFCELTVLAFCMQDFVAQRHGSVNAHPNFMIRKMVPSFAHYFKKLSAALDSIRINLNSVEENVTFNVQNILWSSIFLPRAILLPTRLGVVLMHVHPNSYGHDSYHLSPIILRTFSSFGQQKNQFKQCFNSVTLWRKFNFQCSEYLMNFDIFRMQFCCPCAAGHGSVHTHPNFMIFTIFRPLFYETFSSFGQHK